MKFQIWVKMNERLESILRYEEIGVLKPYYIELHDYLEDNSFCNPEREFCSLIEQKFNIGKVVRNVMGLNVDIPVHLRYGIGINKDLTREFVDIIHDLSYPRNSDPIDFHPQLINLLPNIFRPTITKTTIGSEVVRIIYGISYNECEDEKDDEKYDWIEREYAKEDSAKIKKDVLDLLMKTPFYVGDVLLL